MDRAVGVSPRLPRLRGRTSHGPMAATLGGSGCFTRGYPPGVSLVNEQVSSPPWTYTGATPP